ncbi:hypothetical protein MTR67_043744 [Solanum verrucosum]|uniref:Integrase zinc-binding domain-containing protein n=1 Tax=Solanum verrucosum TaxID=315347 RepID=A0AAF0ZVF3_SOLVR|nr:hypothetical protein MTR67_043744 [Solanum verrucosum]
MRTILERFREEKLYAKLSNCEFLLEFMAFLGQVVTKEGVSLGGVLMKKWSVIVYASRQLKGPELLLILLSVHVASTVLIRVVAFVEARSILMDHICAHQLEDDKLKVIWEKVLKGEAKSASLYPEGALRICGYICVPSVGGWVCMILGEGHYSKYSIHPRTTKMFHDLKQHYWWCGIKRDIVDFVAKCWNRQQVKYKD